MSVNEAFPAVSEGSPSPHCIDAASCGLEHVDRLPRPEEEEAEQLEAPGAEADAAPMGGDPPQH